MSRSLQPGLGNIGALVTGAGLAKEIADVFLGTEFMGGRHETRVGMITEIENEQ